jgi:hypothetical protein
MSDNVYSSGEGAESSSKTITYNIGAYNRTGSFTIQWGGQFNGDGKFEGFVRSINQEGRILQEITLAKLDKQLEKLVTIKRKFMAEKIDNVKINKAIASLEEFKVILGNKEKFNSYFEKINSIEGGLPFNHTISTIRGQSDEVTGSIND